MKKKSQKDAIYEIVQEVLGELYSPDKDMRPLFGSYDSRELQLYPYDPESSQRMKIAINLFLEKIESGEVARPKSRTNNINFNLERYARNIIFNWLRKDKRLNGNTSYKPQKSAKFIIEKDSIVHQLTKLRNSIRPHDRGQVGNFDGGRYKYSKDQLDIMAEINKAIHERSDELRDYGSNMYIVAKCLCDENIQLQLRELIRSQSKNNSFLQDLESIKQVESIFISIIRKIKKDIEKDEILKDAS